jgi:CheY-like chemotaxis protein
MPKLVVLTGNSAGVSLELTANWVAIGRAEGNTYQITDTSISSRHCEILLRGNEVVVCDLNSTNGTYIKGQRITKGILRPGQTLQLGQVELRLEGSPPVKKAKAKPAGQSETAGTSAKKHQVLFVDDDQPFLEAITALYDIFGDRTWEIHRAASADQALAALKEKHIDLVVLDIGMPVLDGMQLLTLIHRRYPDLKKAVLTGSAIAGYRETCLASGAELFMSKPLSSEGMKAVFTTLNELIVWAQSRGFSGMLRQVGLPDVVQMECLSRHSSILEVRNQRMHGQIYIETGAIVHAMVGALRGEKAFYRLLSLTGGEFRLQPFQAPPENTIQGQWEFLVMEAARVHDEEATTLITRADVAGQPLSSAPELQAVEENLVGMVARDGNWHPVAGSKKAP